MNHGRISTCDVHLAQQTAYIGNLRMSRLTRKRGPVPPLRMRLGSDSWFDAGLDRLFLNSASDVDSKKIEANRTSESGEQLFLLVLDDNDHTIDEIIKLLRRSIRCSWMDALKYTLEIGTSGRGIVLEASRQECERAQAILSKEKVESKVLTASEAEADAANEAKKAANPEEPKAAPKPSWGRNFKNGPRPRVTVIGGTGRVGMWTIRELHRFASGDVDFVVAGRNAAAAARLCRQLRGDPSVFGGREWSTMRTPLLGSAEFRAVSLQDPQSIADAVAGSDLGAPRRVPSPSRHGLSIIIMENYNGFPAAGTSLLCSPR
jgi:hypothetical protein